MEILRQVAGDYVTNRVRPEDLPMKAAEALARGVDSPSLCELAGLGGKSDVRDIHDLFVAAMGELGEEIPDPRTVRWNHVRFWAHRMIAGTVTAYEGACWIRTESFRLEEPPKLRQIYILTLLWEDDPAQRRALEASMLKAAQQLLEAPPPSKASRPLWVVGNARAAAANVRCTVLPPEARARCVRLRGDDHGRLRSPPG